LLAFILLFSLIVLAVGEGMAQKPSRVVILPFQINADQDLSYLREGIVDMLTSRLSWENRVVVVPEGETNQVIKDVSLPPSEAVARDIGTRLQASHVLFGSVTIFGNRVSLDGSMVDVHQTRPTLTFFNEGKEMGEVIPQVNLFVSEINEKVFGRPVAGRPQVAPVPERLGIYAHPETLLAGQEKAGTGSAAAEAPATAGFAVVSRAPADMTVEGFWKSQNFQTVIQGITLGDVDGDGRTEVVFISDHRISVYRFENQRLFKIWAKEGKMGHRFIGIDVADVNRNGRAEIFVTGVKMPAQLPDSLVLEWDGHDFRTVSEGGYWYYRVINMPDRGPVLLGQKGKMADLFVGGVYELIWRDGDYRPGERLTLPKGVNIFGFAVGDVMNNGEQMTAAFDAKDHILLYSRAGEEQWKSDERYGGSMNYLEFRMDSGRGDNMDRLYLPQRIFIYDVNRDGKHEVVVPSNQGSVGRLFARFRKFSSGRTVVLSWSGSGLVPIWQTPKTSAHVSDCAIGDFDHDGRDEVIVAHTAKQGTMITEARSSIIGYELPQTASAQQ